MRRYVANAVSTGRRGEPVSRRPKSRGAVPAFAVPTESRRTIEERYDLCEDMAIQTSEFCHVLQFREDLSEADVLRRCLASLRAGDAVSHDEARWVMVRVAELLQWPWPDPSA